MTAAAAEHPVAGPVDSLEVRWIMPGPLPAAVRDWFGCFPAWTQTVQDIYLLRPRLRGLSLKLRDGRTLDVKSCLGSPALHGLPVRGRVESWRKWSFPCDPQDPAGSAPAGWVPVRKQRRISWFPLAAGQDPAPEPPPAAQAGCAVELTEFHVHGDPYWTAGFEATGPPGLLPDALRHAAVLVFARPLPAGVEFGLGNSRSYAQWLTQRHSPDALGVPQVMSPGLPAAGMPCRRVKVKRCWPHPYQHHARLACLIRAVQDLRAGPAPGWSGGCSTGRFPGIPGRRSHR